MKNKLIGFLCLLFAVAVLTACGDDSESASANDSKVYELNLNVSASPTSEFMKNVATPWAEYVNEETNGAVKVNVFPSAALGSFNTAFNDIGGGVYEAGIVPPGLHEDTVLFPLTIADTPFLINSPALAQKVLTSFVDEFMQEGAFTDTTFMSIASTDAFQLYGNTPVKSPKDIEHKKLSDSVAGRLTLYKSIGAVPISLTNTELYESLERGIADFVAYTAVGANGFKFDEVAKHMTKMDVGVSVLPFLMNTDFLNSLPEEIKTQFIEDFGPKYSDMTVELYSTAAEEGVQIFEELVEKDGGGVYIPTAEELNEFKKPVRAQLDNWVKEANKRGYDGEAMREFLLDFLEKEGVSIPE